MTTTAAYRIYNLLGLSDDTTHIGYRPGATATAANCVVVGQNAMMVATGAGFNTCVGVAAGRLISTGFENTFIGYQAGLNVTTGGGNVSVGCVSLPSLQTGNNNTCVGYQAAFTVTGSDSVFVGQRAGMQADGCQSCVHIGKEAGMYMTKNCNVTLGYQAGKGTATNNSENCTIIGYCAGLLLGGATSASNNTLIGYQAGNAITTGTGNTFIGASASSFASTCTNAIAIGSFADITGTNAGAITIGTPSACSGAKAIAIGSNASSAVANGIAIGADVTADMASSIIFGNGNRAFTTGSGRVHYHQTSSVGSGTYSSINSTIILGGLLLTPMVTQTGDFLWDSASTIVDGVFGTSTGGLTRKAGNCCYLNIYNSSTYTAQFSYPNTYINRDYFLPTTIASAASRRLVIRLANTDTSGAAAIAIYG